MGSSMQNEPKRYFAAIRLGSDVPPDQLGRRVEGLRQLVSNLVQVRRSIGVLVRRRAFRWDVFPDRARHSDYPGRARQGHHIS